MNETELSGQFGMMGILLKVIQGRKNCCVCKGQNPLDQSGSNINQNVIGDKVYKAG